MAIYPDEKRAMSFLALESVANINEGYSRCFKVARQQLLLVHSGGVTKLIPAQCPHENYSLKKATLDNGKIRCRKHGIAFCLDTGQAVGGEVVASVPGLQPITLIEQNGYLGVLTD
ncbi:MAG: Rieske 2Fe-2S domain-containing protein [Porticoccaceae bacterium]|nr:Rieske 2Fe-2S domain-containing protein [Pseudomonadales bacterium]MCP5171602.1 Rieske 2Fe-2S domain-containing protein [Pseudomonadales bacterium]